MYKKLLTLCVLAMTLSSFGQCGIAISGPPTACQGAEINLTTDYTGSGTLHWTSTSGSFSSTTGNNVSFYTAAADTGQVLLYATIRDSGQACDFYGDTLSLQINTAHIYAGPDQTICGVSAIDLQAYASSMVSWMSSGTGSFTTTSASATTYYPTVDDTINGFVEFYASTMSNGCTKQDTVVVTFVDGPAVVNAGADKTICASAPSVAIVGSASAGALVWSTSGTGMFLYQGADTTRYAPSAADIANGTVEIKLTSTGCGLASDSMTLQIVPSPQLEIGADQYLSTQNNLTANISVASGLVWTTSGSGIFLPNNTALTVTYQASVADQLSSGVYINAYTTGNGSCDPAYDNLMLFRDTACSLNAGPDQVVCSNDTVDLHATISEGAVEWSTTGAGSIFQPDSLDARYIPAAADANTDVYFICNGTNGSCISTDTVKVTFTNSTSIANANSDEITCANSTYHIVSGYTNTPAQYWTSTGTGYFEAPDQDSTVYYPSTNDKLNGAVTLTLTAIGCGAVSDSKVLSFIPGPVVEAGPNQALATTNTLTATVVNAAGVLWTTNGSGVFSNPTSLSTVYTPSQSDIDSGYVSITITTIGNGACEAAYDQLILTGNAVVCNINVTKSQVGNTVDFVASNSDGSSVGSYYWEFGDGTYAYGKQQSHTYADTGYFYAVAYYTTPNGLCSDTAGILVRINAVVTSTFNISGTIFANANRIDYAYATLFELEGDVYKYMQTVELGTGDNGNYEFTNVPNGQYIIYAIPTFQSSYVNFIPCYFPNVTLWAGATSIVVNNGDQTGKNIYLIPFTPPSTGWNLGDATILGTITFDASATLRVNDPSANPSQYAVVYLYNSSNELLATTNTDEFGNYSFDGIAAGNYTLKVEYPGGKAGATSFPVTTTSGNTSQVNTEITREEIISSLESSALSNTTVAVYPNPVQGDLTISITGGDAQVELYNSMGALVQSISTNGSRAGIDMSSLPAGIYSYVVKQGEQKFAGKVMKQ